MPAMPFHRQSGAAAAARWFAGEAGQAVLASEDAVVQAVARERPGQPWLWLTLLPPRRVPPRALCLWPDGKGFSGSLACTLPLPLASGSVAAILLQHVGDGLLPMDAVLAECERVLVDGGRLWLLGLNPLAPYRLRWIGAGPRAAEPITWRWRLRRAGFEVARVAQGLGPCWQVVPAADAQEGAGIRAAFLLEAEKRVIPLTPVRLRSRLRWQPGVPTVS